MAFLPFQMAGSNQTPLIQRCCLACCAAFPVVTWKMKSAAEDIWQRKSKLAGSRQRAKGVKRPDNVGIENSKGRPYPKKGRPLKIPSHQKRQQRTHVGAFSRDIKKLGRKTTDSLSVFCLV